VFRGRNTIGVLLAAVAALLLFPAAGQATFPGTNGRIAFTSERDGNPEIYSMNPDGSGVVRLTNDPGIDGEAAWSPDGKQILFASDRGGPAYAFQIWLMNSNGSGQTQLTTEGGTVPVWYPDGGSFEYMQNGAVHRRTLDGSSDVQLTPPSPPCDYYDPDVTSCDTYVDFDLSPDGTQVITERIHTEFGPCPPRCGDDVAETAYLSNGSLGAEPSWAPDQSRIGFNEYSWGEFAGFHYALGTERPDGSDRVILRDGATSAAWSPDGTRIAFVESGRIKLMDPDGTNVTDIGEGSAPAWKSIPVYGYPRPKGATPIRLSLVPAATQCTSPDNTHGAPLSYGSCTPPTLSSQYLTTGTPDANGLPVRMSASLSLKVVPGSSSTPGDQADVAIDAHVNDVLNKDLSDYSGSLAAALPIRLTDKDNAPSPVGAGAATTKVIPFTFAIPCTPDPDPLVGSDCSISTSADTVVPGAIGESLRAIWQIGQVRVFDGGADSDGSTAADNTVFAVPGVFVP
jgi:TolB protein